MHYFLIAGEASGDLHGSHLIKQLRSNDPGTVVTFLGGDMMAAAAGIDPVIHYSRMAFMGFTEVIKNLGKVTENLRRAKDALRISQPDALILIDYPSFNLKMAATAKKLGIPVYYYISPKIWAWKKWRIADIRRNVRLVLSILPFEPAFYKENGFGAVYVGNPSVGEVDSDLATALTREEFLKKWRLRDRPLVALMPGSRRAEIRSNLPVMRLAVDRFPQYRGVIIGAPGVPDSIYAAMGGINMPVIRERCAAHVLTHCRAALVTSGTATLETALAGVPQVACYRSNGAKITYDIMSRILKIEHVTLPNLIAGKGIIPEMLIHRCTPDLVADELAPVLRLDSPERAAQLDGYADMRRILGTRDAAATAAGIIIRDLRRQH